MTLFKREGAMEGYSDQLALFKMPPHETGILKKEWIEYQPVNGISENSPIDFFIPSTGFTYIDLRNTRLKVRFRILKPNGENPGLSDPVTTVNLALHSMFNQVDVSLQQVPLPGSGTNYPYKSIIETLLGYGSDCKKSRLQSQLYYKDDAEYMDDVQMLNSGFAERMNQTSGGAIVEVEGDLKIDCFQGERLLVNGVQITCKLWPSRNEFALMSGTNPPDHKLVILDAVMKICHVTMDPGVIVAQGEIMQKTPAIYPVERTEVKTYSVAAGNFIFTAEDPFQGEVPAKLVVGIVSAASYAGAFNLNPFNFKSYDVNYLGFFLDGQSVPAAPFQPDFEANCYTSSYLGLFAGRSNDDWGNDIAKSDFKGGYALYVFDVYSPEGLIRKGHTRLQIRFGKALEEVATVVVYAVFPSLLQIDSSRKILL